MDAPILSLVLPIVYNEEKIIPELDRRTVPGRNGVEK
jgi:hypothetical protein